MNEIRAFAILDYLKDKKYATIKMLCEQFGASVATVYRDIAFLSARGVIRRVRGGVAFAEHTSRTGWKDFSASPYQERQNWKCTAKQQIAEKAFAKISEGDIIFLDSSTTVSWLADKLIDSSFANLTVVTNSVTISQKFSSFPSQYILICLGGCYDLQLNSFLGQSAIRELERLSISKAFVSAFGYSDDGITTNHENHASLLVKVLQLASRKYLLADKSKHDRTGLFRFADKCVFDEIITE